MADNRELEVLPDAGDGDHMSENAGIPADVQRGNTYTDEPASKKMRFRKIRRTIKDPFKKKKLKELKQENHDLKTAVNRLREKLLKTITDYPRGKIIIASARNVQVGNTNHMNNDSVSDIGEIQEAVDNLTDAAYKLLKELSKENENRNKENTELKRRHERSETKLDELKDLVLQCSSKISEQDVNHAQALEDLKDLQALVIGISDDKMVEDGISAIPIEFVQEYDLLPYQTKRLVTRLVHLFGQEGLDSLCEELQIDNPKEVFEIGGHGDSGISKDSYGLLLNKDICAKILADWLNKPSSNAKTVLLNIIETHERQRYGQTEYTRAVVFSRENKYVQTSCRHIAERCDSSEKYLFIDDNHFSYN